MQKAAVTTRFEDKPNRTTIKEVPVPELKAGQILVRINSSGLCNNDVALMRNYWSHFPFQSLGQGIAGHEGVGDVVAIADDVVDECLWSLGDRVGIKWITSVCHECEFCTSGNEVNCPKLVYSGFTTPGTFQQYVATDARTALRIPDGISDEAAASMLCGGLTSYVAIKKSQVPPGKWIVLLGAGGGAGHVSYWLSRTTSVLRPS
jgi:alcohol dehydrogenase, propanol-preferring